MSEIVKKIQERSLYDCTKEHFEKRAKTYLIVDTNRASDFDIIESIVPKVNEKNIKIVDVGCGPGQHLVLLSTSLKEKHLNYSISGVDYSRVVLAEAQTNLRINDIKNVKLLLADGRELPIGSSEVSLALCMNNVLGNIPAEGTDRKIAVQNAEKSRLDALKEINRILVPGGYVVISVYHRGSEHYSADLKMMEGSSPSIGDYVMLEHSTGTLFYSHWFTRKEVEDLLKSTNFELIELHEKDSRIIAVARKK